MQYLRSIKYLIFITTFVFLPKYAFAAANCTFSPTAAPAVDQILCPIYAVLNVATAVSGVIFSIILAYVAYRYVMAQGDPKELMLINNIGKYAIMGFVGVIGAFTIISITVNALGISSDFSPSSPNFYTKFKDGVNSILQIANITPTT